MLKTIDWQDSKIVMIDQTRLPIEENYITYTDYQGVAEAIKTMIIRGAPAMAVAAAMGIALGAQKIDTNSFGTFQSEFINICDIFSQTRPTAVNLFWAINRMKEYVNIRFNFQCLLRCQWLIGYLACLTSFQPSF